MWFVTMYAACLKMKLIFAIANAAFLLIVPFNGLNVNVLFVVLRVLLHDAMLVQYMLWLWLCICPQVSVL